MLKMVDIWHIFMQFNLIVQFLFPLQVHIRPIVGSCTYFVVFTKTNKAELAVACCLYITIPAGFYPFIAWEILTVCSKKGKLKA